MANEVIPAFPTRLNRDCRVSCYACKQTGLAPRMKALIHVNIARASVEPVMVTEFICDDCMFVIDRYIRKNITGKHALPKDYGTTSDFYQTTGIQH